MTNAITLRNLDTDQKVSIVADDQNKFAVPAGNWLADGVSIPAGHQVVVGGTTALTIENSQL